MAQSDKFASRSLDGTKQEKIASRPSEYSAWHRTLGPEYQAADIDFVEYRRGRGIVAIIDVTGEMEDERHLVNSKKFIWERTSTQREIIRLVSQALKVPGYFVLYTKDLQFFHVHDMSKSVEEYVKMGQKEYENFIRSL